MRNSTKLAACILYFTICGFAKSNDSSKSFYLGNFQGSGRACYGKLILKAKSVSWNTTYSSCKTSHYTILELDQSGPKWAIVLERKVKDKKCYYPVIRLTHEINMGSNIGWSIEGFKTPKAYHEESVKDSIGCYVYRI